MCERDAAQRRVGLTVAADGFLYADGVKLPAKYIAERGVLQFVDTDRRSVRRRGSRYVEVAVGDVVKLLRVGDSPD